MDNVQAWNSLRNTALGAAVLCGVLAGFSARYCCDARYTSQWRLERYAASCEQASAVETTGINASAVQ